MTKISKTYYKNVSSIVLESSLLKVTVMPIGARISSIIRKDRKKEYLIQQQGEDYINGKYDEKYVECGPGGFDDMFPCIDECFYQDYPWEGTKIPDHGELWGINWDYSINKSNLEMSVNGVRFPYFFSKSISFSSEDKLSISYCIKNLSEFDLDFIWTAHPMFNTEDNLEILLPEDCCRGINALSFSKIFEKSGQEFNWPDYKDLIGVIHKLDKLSSIDKRSCEKYYFKDKLKEGWVKLKYPSCDSEVTINFPVDKIPYLGIVVDKDYFKDGMSYIIPEPCTAPYDRLDLAKSYGKNSVLPARETFKWDMDITIE